MRDDGRAWWRRDDVFAAALLAVALIPRLYVALAWSSEPVWDGHYYDFGARRIAEGLGYSDDRSVDGMLVWHPWCHYPVGYSAFLAFFYRVFGATHAVAGIVNACVGAALALVTWRLATHALSPVRARAAGVLVAVHPGLVLYSALVMSEPLAALATLTAFLVAAPNRSLTLAAGKRVAPPLAPASETVSKPRASASETVSKPRASASGSSRWWQRWQTRFVASALLLGLAALVRPQALLCAPFLALFVPEKRVVRRLAAAAIACALALLPVLPWTARNCRVMDGCALVSTNAGWNLAIGAFPRATGRFETLRSSDGCREVTGQVQQDRCWLEYGIAQIRATPGHWLSLVPSKLGYTFDHESFAVEYLHEARPEAWPEARRVAVRDVTTMFHRLLVCAAALGCVAFRVRGKGAATQGVLLACALALMYLAFAEGAPTFWPLVLFSSVVPWLRLPGRSTFHAALLAPVALLDTTVVTHAVFFGEDRYHVVVTPVLCMLAACALRRRSSRKALDMEKEPAKAQANGDDPNDTNRSR